MGYWGRPSRSLLTLAIAVSIVLTAAGSVAVWAVYARGYRTTPHDSVRAPSARPIQLGIARTPGGPAEWITLARVFAQMQRDLGRPVVVHYALSSEDQVRMFETGQLDVALMSTMAYLDVEEAGLVKAVATPVIKHQPMDAAVVVVPYDSQARSVEDLRGKSFAVSPDLAGAAYAYWVLEQIGEAPVGFFSETVTDVQDENLSAVENGRVDATSVRQSALAHWPEHVFRVIEQSPDLGMPPVVVRKSLDRETADEVQQSLLGAARIIPAGSAITGFRAPSETEYDFARELDGIQRHLEFEAFGSAHQ